MTDRLLQTEEHVAHLLKTVDELSDVVARQGREIEALTRRVEMLMRREAERMADEGIAVPVSEKPPHY